MLEYGQNLTSWRQRNAAMRELFLSDIAFTLPSAPRQPCHTSDCLHIFLSQQAFIPSRILLPREERPVTKEIRKEIHSVYLKIQEDLVVFFLYA